MMMVYEFSIIYGYSLRKNINSKVMGIDISSEAITVARKNILDESENVDLVNDSIEKFKTDKMFDVIVSNPPYIPISDKKLVDSLVLDNEPKTALFTQDDPLYFYRQILVFAKKNSINKPFSKFLFRRGIFKNY